MGGQAGGRRAAVIVGLVWLLAGCAAAKDETLVVVQGVKELADVKAKVSPKLKESPPRLVAIMPFENLTDKTAKEEDRAPENVIRTAFQNHFHTRRYEYQRTVVTDRLLQEKGYVKPEDIAALPVAKLGEMTKADAVIQAKITHFNRLYVGLYAQIAIGVQIKMVETKTGEVLWETGDVARTHSGGVAADPLGLAVILASNAWALRHIEVVRASEELFRDLIQTLPKLETGQAVKTPTITLLVNDSSTLMRKAGDQIKVAIEGDANMLATFDIGSMKTGLVMKEEKPGAYLGVYTVKPGDNGDKLIVVGHLADGKGLTTDWEDVLGPVTVDTMPPAVPAALTAVGRDKAVSLRWKANAEPDLAGYKVYRSATALTGFAPLVSIEAPAFLDTKEQVNLKPVYYRLTAFDKAGNESQMSEPLAGVPVAPGPTSVGGTITLNTTWYAGASPYIIESEVTVAQGATLTIEQGTVVKSKGGGLIVRGGLIAKGTEEDLITFVPDPAAPGQAWKGIIFDQTGTHESWIERVRISGAAVGVSCVAASPHIVRSEIGQNKTGIVVRLASSKPIIEGNQIVLNEEDGITVQEAASPVLTGNHVAQNKRYGLAISKAPGLAVHGNDLVDNGLLQVWNASGTEVVELSGNWWGTTDPAKVLAKVDGAVSMKDVLDGPVPAGKVVALSGLDSELGGSITSSAVLLTAKSPYLVTRPVIIEKGATLTIQAGVIIRFKPGENSLIVKDGAVQAMGTAARPVIFTSANASPRPGDYASAVRFEGGGPQPSFLKHARIEYASTGVVVKDGHPEIAHAYIANNLQSALECGGKSSPKVSFSTLTDHPNNAAVIASGKSQPTLYRNNIVKNAWGVINHSSLPLEARENWWGASQPDEALFLGLIEYKPALAQPEPGAGK